MASSAPVQFHGIHSGAVYGIPGTAVISVPGYGAPLGARRWNDASAGAYAGPAVYGDYFGEAEDDVTDVNSGGRRVDIAELVTGLAPAISAITGELTDPFRKVAILEAKLADARRRGASLRKIGKLEAKLAAAKRATGMEEESERATREWRAIGQSGGIIGIGVGLALIYVLLETGKAQKRRG